MSFQRLCEYKGWKKKGGENCFRRKNYINGPRERCDGPKGCVWRSKSSRSPRHYQSPKKSISPPSCVWGKRSIFPDRVGTCYNRDAVRFDKTGWKKCNYPSNCKGKNSYGQTIYRKNESDDENNSTENSPRRGMTCDEEYIFNYITKLDTKEKEVLNFIVGHEGDIETKVNSLIEERDVDILKIFKKLNINNIFERLSGEKQKRGAESETKKKIRFLQKLQKSFIEKKKFIEELL